MNKTMKEENLFLKKRQEALEKKLGCKFIRNNARAIIQTMKLVKYKYLSVTLKTKK